MRDECHWCGRLDELSEHPFTDHSDGGVELLCYACVEDSYTCIVCTNISGEIAHGRLSDDQPKDVCNECHLKNQNAISVLEGHRCTCGTMIDPETACMDLGIPHCQECGNMFKEFLS